MEFPITIESQAEFDGLVQKRINRVEAKYADYDTITQQLTEAKTALAAAESAKTAAETRANDFESQVQGLTQEKQLTEWRDEVAEATGVNASVLRGGTKEELEAHAAQLQEAFPAPGAGGQGQQPRGDAVGSLGNQPQNPGVVSLTDQIKAAEAANNPELVSQLKAMQLGA